MPLPVWEGP
ncbi:unnamed protein product, partial [Allacma fusca]